MRNWIRVPQVFFSLFDTVLKRGEIILWYVFFLTLPLGIKKVIMFTPTPSGDRVLSFYLFDFFVVLFFLFWCRKRRWRAFQFRLPDLLLLCFLGVMISSLFFHPPIVSLNLYFLFRFIEGVFLYFYFASISELNKAQVILCIVFGAIFEFGLGIAQFFLQHTLGLHMIGEPPFGKTLPGTATFRFHGERIVRVPGTFLHPNIFSAFLLLSSFLILSLFLEAKERGHKILWGFLYFANLFTILAASSRSAIIAFVIVTPFYLLWRAKGNSWRVFLPYVFLVLVIWFSVHDLLIARFGNLPNEISYKNRVIYNEIGLKVLRQSPLLGVGLGNFVSYVFTHRLYQQEGLTLSYLFQPVHNLFLLIADEIGIAGLLLFLIFLVAFYRMRMGAIREDPFVLVFGCVGIAFLLLGLTDHYFWDLEQGILLFWVVFGLFRNQGPHSSMDRV